MRASRRAVLTGMAAAAATPMVASAATAPGAARGATDGAAAGPDGGPGGSVTYPAGFRLGVVVPPTLRPNVVWNSPRDLLSADHTLRVDLREPPFFGSREDASTWAREPAHDHDLVREWQPAPDEWRRLFVDRGYGDSEDYGGRTLLIYHDRWFGRIDASIGSLAGPIDSENGQLARWRGTVDALLASATVRAPVSVPQFTAEHGIALDADGLHPRHFASKLVLSPRAPRDPGEAWSMDDYLAMESPPRPFERERMARDYPEAMAQQRAAAERAWTANGIEWLAARPLAVPLNGGTMHTRTVAGHGERRSVEWTAYARTDPGATFAALDRVVASFAFVEPR